MLFSLLITLSVVAAIFLILVILAQNSKGGGLSSQFGGSGVGNFIGIKKTGDLLEKLTWGFSIAIILLSLAANKIQLTSSYATDEILEKVQTQEQQLPSLNLDQPQEAEAIDPATDSIE